MKISEIKKIEEILLVDKPLLKHKIASAVAPENGGSFLLNVDLRLKNDKNFEEKLEVVAKLAAANINNSGRAQSFENEVIFYKNIVPLLQDFYKLQGAETIDIFPKYYGGRLTLNPRNKEADKDAIFFLENLESSGFKTLDPHIGFDLETTKLILKTISRFHAGFLAIKLRKPEVFKHKIKPYINKFNISVDAEEIKKVVSLMWGNEGCVSLIPRIRRAMSRKEQSPGELFSTIIHNNLWTGNVMVKLDENGCSTVKVVDFQHYDYGSPAADVIFFLFTSVEISVLEDHLDDLFTHYHDHFVAELKNFEIEEASFPLENFLKEITAEATTVQFPHIMTKINNIFSTKQEKQHERVWYTVQEFAKRNWI